MGSVGPLPAAQAGHQGRADQRDPVHRQHARRPLHEKGPQSRRPTEIAAVHMQDDETAEHEEQVHADMPEVGQCGVEGVTGGFFDVTTTVVGHHPAGGGAAQGIDQFELVALGNTGTVDQHASKCRKAKM